MATAIHQYEDKLLDFAYGELPAPEASAVESHVKTCPRCTQALEQIRGVRVTMAQLPQEPAPTAGLESLLAYAEQAAKRTAEGPRATAPWWRRMVAPLAGAAALMLVVVVAVKSQEDVGMPSRETAALQNEREKAGSPAPVVAEAPAPQAAEAHAPVVAQPPPMKAPEPPAPKLAEERLQAGKVEGGARGAEDERKSKEDRNWDQGALAKNVDQKLGGTPDPQEQNKAGQLRDLGDSMNTAKASEKRRAVAKDMPSNNDNGELDRAYGAPATKEAKPKPVAKPQAPADKSKNDEFAKNYMEPKQDAKKAAAPAEEKPQDIVAAREPAPTKSSPYGISSGAGGLGTNAPNAAPPPPPAVVAKTEAAPAPSAATSAPSQAMEQPQAPQPGSLGVGIGSSSYGPTRGKKSVKQISRGTGSAGDDEELVARQEVKGNEDSVRRDEDTVAKGYLDNARAAANAGNREQEVKLSMEVVNSRVQGNLRGEALQRLCNALEALGKEEAADRYCDLLLREFPNSVGAKEVARRRQNAQHASPPKPASKKSEAYDYERAEKQPSPEPSGASPTKVKKASEPAVDAY